MPTPPTVKIDQALGVVAGPYLQPVLKAAAARGVAAGDLAMAAGLPGDTLLSLPESLQVYAYVRLLDSCAPLAHYTHFRQQ